MARDYLKAVLDIEGYYPRAFGGQTKDDVLRLSLSRWTSNIFKEVERIRRWPFAYGTATIVTVAGTQIYPIPVGILAISNFYYIDTGGNPVTLENYTQQQMRQAFGEGSLSAPGAPTKYSILGSNIEVFPVPDSSGPTSGNYTLIVEGYQQLQPIVETSGTTIALSTSMTVPSTAGLTANGLAASGTTGVSIRASGNAIVVNAAGTTTDDLVTNWTAFPDATHVTLSTAAVTAQTNTQVFFNSQNWLLTDYPKVVVFGVLREVASYLKAFDDYKTWEQRYQQELELMAEFAVDRQMSLEQLATATLGQRINQLRRLDVLLGVEVRGGVL